MGSAQTRTLGTHEARPPSGARLAGWLANRWKWRVQCKVKRQLCLIISQIIVSSNPLVRHSGGGGGGGGGSGSGSGSGSDSGSGVDGARSEASGEQ